MSQLTITEALAELKTIGKRLDRKREFVGTYIFRQERLKDPLGDSAKAIASELQSIEDLHKRVIAIRSAISAANTITPITIGKTTMPVADWLVWRREVAPRVGQLYNDMRSRIEAARKEASKIGAQVVSAGSGEPKPIDVIVNFSESELAVVIEGLAETLGALDGQLSLKNATILLPL